MIFESFLALVTMETLEPFFVCLRRFVISLRLASTRFPRSVAMLNIMVYLKDHRVFTKAVFKSTSLGVPLSGDSAHPPHVHRGWPVSAIRSSLKLCTTAADQQVGDVYIDRFVRHCAPPGLIHVLQSTLLNYINAGNSPEFVRLRTTSIATCLPAVPAAWCVLPFHPLWSQLGLYRFIHTWSGIKFVGYRISSSNYLKPALVQINLVEGRLGQEGDFIFFINVFGRCCAYKCPFGFFVHI
jgi:hypothetical protein